MWRCPTARTRRRRRAHWPQWKRPRSAASRDHRRTASAIVSGASTPVAMINRNAIAVHPAVPGGGSSATQHRHINPKRGQDQRHPEQGEQHDRETTRPPARQLIAHRDGEDHNQQAGDNKGRNLRPTVRPARQRPRPRDLLAAHEFPAKLMKVTKAGPGVQSHRNHWKQRGVEVWAGLSVFRSLAGLGPLAVRGSSPSRLTCSLSASSTAGPAPGPPC